MSDDFSKKDLVEMMSKPFSNWLTFAEQRQAAYKSGRPLLLKNKDMFKKMAKDEGIEALFNEVWTASEKL